MPRRAGDGNDAQGTPGPQQTPPGGMSSEMSGSPGSQEWAGGTGEPGRGQGMGNQSNIICTDWL